MTEEAYGEAILKKKHVYDWHKRFHDGRESVDDDPNSAASVRSSVYSDAHDLINYDFIPEGHTINKEKSASKSFVVSTMQ